MTHPDINIAGTDPSTEAERVYVTLHVAGQLCGVPLEAVRDVLSAQAVTRIPLAAPEIAGSLNLRGRIVTAIDLRRRLRLPPAGEEATPMSVVAEQGTELYALLVDQVSEVMSLPARLFEQAPPTLAGGWAEFNAGVYRLTGQLLVVLDVDRLLALAPREA